MDLKLENKTALITASSGGIGFKIAESLAREGAIVYINGRNEDVVNSAIERILSSNASAKLKALPFNAGTRDGGEKLMKALGEVDILVNNLGIYEERDFFEIPEEKWEEMFEVNVLSGVRLAKHFMPKMFEKNWGRVIFIASEAGIMIPPNMIHYGFTKTANISVSSGLARLTQSTGVTVNSVLPGPTATEGVREFVAKMAEKEGKSAEEMSKAFISDSRPSSLAQRFLNPEEIANVVTFIASPLSSAINGAAVRAEGGLLHSII